ELALEPAAAEVVQALERHRGVAQDLHGLDAGDLVEEPAAGSVHEHSIALQLEQAADFDAAGVIQYRADVRGEELAEPVGPPVEEHRDVGVARGPRIF